MRDASGNVMLWILEVADITSLANLMHLAGLHDMRRCADTLSTVLDQLLKRTQQRTLSLEPYLWARRSRRRPMFFHEPMPQQRQSLAKRLGQ